MASSGRPRATSRFDDPQELVAILISACEIGDDAVVESLVHRDPVDPSKPGLLTLEVACEADGRHDSSTYGLTALHCCKNAETAEKLLNFGVPVDIKGRLGQTPLHTCCEYPQVVGLLLAHDANPNATTKDGSTPLEWAVVADSLESLRLMFDKGGDINHANDNGNTCLHLVTSTQVTEFLLEKGARVSAENKYGQIPLETAAERKGEPEAEKIAELLLDVSHDRGLRNRVVATSTLSTRSLGVAGADGLSSRTLLDAWTPLVENHASASTSAGSLALSTAEAPEQHQPQEAPQQPQQQQQTTGHRWSLVRQRFLKTGQPQQASSRVSMSGSRISGGGNSPSTTEWPGAAEDMAETGSVRSLKSMDLLEDAGPVEGFYSQFFYTAVSERPFLAKRLLDKQRKFLFAKGTSKVYSYDFCLLGTLATTTGLRTIVEHDRKDLVVHDVVQYLVNAKWTLITRDALMKELALHVLFIACFTFSSLDLKLAYDSKSPINSAATILAEVCLVSLSLRAVFRWFREWRSRGGSWQVLGAIVRADKLTGSLFFILPLEQTLRMTNYKGFDVLCTALMAAASILVWIRLLYFGEPLYQPIGVTMAIVRRMIVDISEYVMCMFVLLLGFAHAMTIIFLEQKNTTFPSFGVSLVNLFFFVFNVDPATIDSPVFSLSAMATLILVMFQMLIVIIFVNLIIAVMTNTYENIMQNSKEEWLLQRAKFVVRIEDQINFGMSGYALKQFQKAADKHQRKVVVVERADGMIEVRVPKVWIEDEEKRRDSKVDFRAYLPVSPSRYGTIQPPASPESGGGLPNGADARANSTKRGFRSFQSSETVKELRPGAMDLFVGMFHRFQTREDLSELLRDPEVLAALTRIVQSVG